VLEGRYGYYALFEGAHDLGPVVASLGSAWRVTELAHKPFPSGRLTHGAIDGLLRLRAAHGFSADEVASVRVVAPPLVARLVGRPDVAAPAASYARLCLPFVAATALLKGTVDVPDFRGNWLDDPDAHDLASRVTVTVAETGDDNASVPQTIEVTLRDGRRHRTRVDTVLGHPDHALSREQHLDKFGRNWTYGAQPLAGSARDRLIALVDGLQEAPDVREVIRTTVP
jgi:2-methylcitrate dehydratase PrpD